MNRFSVVLTRTLFVAICFAAPLLADDDEALKKDLTAVIALHGLPCGQVVAVKVLAESNYDATCKDKNRYHIFLNAAGRVIVEKSK
jgi:hypothetical protein